MRRFKAALVGLFMLLSGCGASGAATFAGAAAMAKPALEVSCGISRWYVDHVCDPYAPPSNPAPEAETSGN